MQQHGADPGQRLAQRRLADDVTERVHGPEAAERARQAAGILFGGGDLRGADAMTLAMVVAEVPTHDLSAGELDGGISLVDALSRTGLATSKADARRGLAGKGYSVNDKVADESRVLTTADLLPGGVVLLRKGKRNWAALRVLTSGSGR
jgi:tyrosyl-tRNA synthetase